MFLWVLDTDVLSAMFKGQLAAGLLNTVWRHPLGVTYVQIGETTRWVSARNWGSTRKESLEIWVNQFPVINGDKAVAKTWGQIVANARKRGRPRSANDSWIAACCLTHGLPLVTLNKRDFADFAAFEGLELIDVGGVR